MPPTNDLRLNAAPASISLASAPVEIRAADGEEKKRPTFSIVGYTGAPVRLADYYTPVIVDLSGLSAERQEIPVLRNHDHDRIVGQTDSVTIDGQGVRMTGSVTGENDDAREVASQARNGFKWQASIGATVVRQEFLKAGEKATVNGRDVSGPMLIAREARLKEISFVALGADSQTSASVAASHPSGTHQGIPMNFDEWVKAKGFDPAALNDVQKASLKAAFDAEQASIQAKAGGGNGGTQPGQAGQGSRTLEEIVAGHTAERDRVGQINAQADKAMQDRPLMLEVIKEMAAAAIEHGKSVIEFKVALFEAMMKVPQAPAVHTKTSFAARGDAPKILEAAISRSAGLGDLEKHYKAPILEAADELFPGNLGYKDVVAVVARENGYTGPTNADIKGLFRAAFSHRDDIRAAGGYSTISLPGILSNVANKFVLMAFMAVEQSWRRISVVRNVRDFKAISSYRLTGGLTYERIGPAGELKHGTLGEQSYSNQARTYGRMLALTREDLINDDLGALQQVASLLGRGAGTALNGVFWTEFLRAVTSFYTAGRGNYFEGAATNLQSSSLVTATRLFRKQTDPDGHPLAIEPRILLVPPELEITADELMTSTAVNTGGASSTDRVPNRNVWQSKYETVMSTYLSNSTITNNSTTHWFLLANPLDLAVIEVAFLNGQQSPTVETADADFATLGVQMRGYHDFGCAQQEYRAGVRSKGTS